MALKILIYLLLVVGVFTTITVTQEIIERAGTNTTQAPTVTNGTTPTINATTPTINATTPDTNTTTPDNNTTTPDNNTTTPDNNTTVPTTNTTVPTTEAPGTTESPAVCASNGPCGSGSTCQERAGQTYVCLCLAGDYYDETQSQCLLAKVFPGEVAITGTYTEAMSKPASKEFKDVADPIQKKLDKAYETNKEYRGSTVTKLSKNTATPAKIMRTAGILATVEIKFDKDSTVKAEEVKKTASDAYPSFQATDLCASNPCDETTTKCSGAEGSFTCDCTDSYVPTVLSDRLCVACPNSYEAVGQICKQCGFGYSGLNCKDNWQLILVIVGSLLSALLLITIIVSTVMALKTKKKLKKGKATDYAKPNLNPAPVRNPHVSNGSAVPRPTPVQASPAGGRPGFGGNVMPRIPRATANEGWDRSNLEMAPSNSRQNLIPAGRNSRRFDEHDDPYSRPNPQNNPYGMGRPQVNPYASNQGHSNPYFRNDN